MSTADSKRLVSRFIEDVFVEHDTSRLDTYVSNEELRQVVPGMLSAFPDIELSVDRLIAEADVVAVHVSARATHLGEFWGMAATGRRWAATASAWYVVQDEKIAAYALNWDWLSIMEQLGAVQRVEPDAA